METTTNSITQEQISKIALEMVSEIDPFGEDTEVNEKYSYYIKGICDFAERLKISN